MTTLADIIRAYGEAFEIQYGHQLLPSQRRTLRDIANCQTVAFGGHLYHCDVCQTHHYQ